MNIARMMSLHSVERHKVGAALYNEHVLVSLGCNTNKEHSEAMAIRRASEQFPGAAFGCTLFVTEIPCKSCFEKIKDFGIFDVIYLDASGDAKIVAT